MLTLSRRINAPVDRVFALSTDLENAAENIPDILSLEVLTDGPVGKGTRFRETRRVFKREATEEMEFVEFVPNDHYNVACESCGCHYETTYRFTPAEDDPNATLLNMEMKVQPLTFGAKIMGVIFFPLRGMMKKCLEKDLDALQTMAESDS